MRIRLSSLFFALLCIPAIAHADGHKADFYAGLVFGDGGSKLTGYNMQFSASSKKADRISFVLADLTQQFGGHNGKDLSQTGYQAGVRVYLTPHIAPHKFYVHGLGGFVYANDGTPEAGSNKAGVFGFGYEFFKKTYVATSEKDPRHTGLGFRAQVDYTARSERVSFVRVSVGGVYRFPRH